MSLISTSFCSDDINNMNMQKCLINNASRMVTKFQCSNTDIFDPLTVLLGELWLLFLQLLQVEWIAAAHQLENLFTRGQGTETMHTIGTFRQMHLDVKDRHIHTVLGHLHIRAQPQSSPGFWGDRLSEEVFCRSCQFSVTNRSFEFSLHLTTI